MKQISILGCGWLGLPLAKALIAEGYAIKGSTTTTEKEAILAEAQIKPYSIQLSENVITGPIANFLDGSTTLLIDIPPKLRSTESENFVAKINQLIPFIEQSTIENVLFVSSTSVFNDLQGLVTKDTVPNPDTESGKQLWETEQLLHSNTHFKTTVLRFGGLIGGNRHPIHFLSGRQQVPNPDAPVNLIHLEDCIGIIKTILKNNLWAQTWNAAAPAHPSRKDYYTQKALEFDLAPPQFVNEGGSDQKIIGTEELQSILKYTFAQPNL